MLPKIFIRNKTQKYVSKPVSKPLTPRTIKAINTYVNILHVKEKNNYKKSFKTNIIHHK